MTLIVVTLVSLCTPWTLARTGLTSLIQIELFNNSLSSGLLDGISNLTQLEWFDASMNELNGMIPRGSCELSGFRQHIDVSYNQFSVGIPTILCHRGQFEELIIMILQFIFRENPRESREMQELNEGFVKE